MRCHSLTVSTHQRGGDFSQIPQYRGHDRDKPIGSQPSGCQKIPPASKKFFSAADKYRKSHCNTLGTWITQPSATPCAVHQRQKLQRYFGSTAAPFIAGASNTEFLGEFTDVPMRSDSADWKRTVFYRRRLLARLVCLVGQYGAGA